MARDDEVKSDATTVRSAATTPTSAGLKALIRKPKHEQCEESIETLKQHVRDLSAERDRRERVSKNQLMSQNGDAEIMIFESKHRRPAPVQNSPPQARATQVADQQ